MLIVILVQNFAGVVPANGEVGIDVIFSPTEFCTAIMELKVCICCYVDIMMSG